MTEQKMVLLIAETLEGRGVGDIMLGGAPCRTGPIGSWGMTIKAEDGTLFRVTVEEVPRGR